jgi:hypothetical protein
MGQSRKNVEAVTDFADGQHFVRLHRDILLPAAVCDAVRRHLAAGRWDDAKAITLEHATADAHAEVHLFFDAAALASGNEDPQMATSSVPSGLGNPEPA